MFVYQVNVEERSTGKHKYSCVTDNIREAIKALILYTGYNQEDMNMWHSEKEKHVTPILGSVNYQVSVNSVAVIYVNSLRCSIIKVAVNPFKTIERDIK